MSTSVGTSDGTAYNTLGRIVAFGAIRLENGLWRLINDDAHKPSGVQYVETLNDCVRIYHNELIPGVGSCWANPDERFALSGVHVGISGGLNYAELWFTQQVGDPPFPRMNPLASVFAQPYTNIWFGIVTR
jgi:hypothetical protein